MVLRCADDSGKRLHCYDIDSSMSGSTCTPPSRWNVSAELERSKLACKESDWILPGTATTTSRTRSGSRAPSMSALSQEGIETDEDETAEEESEDEDDSPHHDMEEIGKPPATRVIVEIADLQSTFEKFSFCQDCHGPLKVEFKTCCLVTNLHVECKDPDCSFVHHSASPATTSVHENKMDNLNEQQTML